MERCVHKKTKNEIRGDEKEKTKERIKENQYIGTFLFYLQIILSKDAFKSDASF